MPTFVLATGRGWSVEVDADEDVDERLILTTIRGSNLSSGHVHVEFVRQDGTVLDSRTLNPGVTAERNLPGTATARKLRRLHISWTRA